MYTEYMSNFSSKKLLLLLAIVLVIGALFFMMFRSGQETKSRISLEVSADKPTYTSGEEITLTAKLTNAGSGETCVSNMETASVRVSSLLRDGEEVATRSAVSYFITSFPKMLESSLVPLPSGESLELILESSRDQGLDAQALRTTALRDGRGVAMFYDVETPGSYKLELVYKYQGTASPECADVFEGETNTATVLFNITSE